MLKPNIFLITIDALRPDRLGCYGCDRPTSPTLDKLADDAVLFMNAFTQGPGTPTSFPALLSGRFVSSGSDRGPCGNDRMLISEMLQSNGYQTVCIQTSPFLMTEMGYNKGYDFFDESYLPFLTNRPNESGGSFKPQKLLPRPIRNIWRFGLKWINKLFYRQAALTGPVVTGKVSSWIQKKRLPERPVFLFTHYEDVHEPYVPPNRYLRLFSSRKLNGKKLMFKGRFTPGSFSWEDAMALRDVYDACIRFTDHSLGVLFDSLHNENMWDNSMVIITADHGEGFMEHGFVSHEPILYNELLRVPLFIKFPYNEYAGIRIADPIRLLDIVPTILDYISTPTFDELDGMSLLPLLKGAGSGPRYAISEAYRQTRTLRSLAVQDANSKLILREIDTDEPFYEFFDLTADPGERHNIWAANPPAFSELESVLKEHVAASYCGNLSDRQEISDSLNDRLRALGYLE